MAVIRFRSRVNNFWFGFILLLIATVAFSWVGIFMLSNNMDMTKNGVLTKATVVELVKHRSSKSTTYRPVIEYLTPTGEKIRTEYAMGSNPPAYAVGDQIRIYFSRTNPEKILADKFFDKYGFPVIFIAAGALCLVIFISVTVRKIKYGA